MFEVTVTIQTCNFFSYWFKSLWRALKQTLTWSKESKLDNAAAAAAEIILSIFPGDKKDSRAKKVASSSHGTDIVGMDYSGPTVLVNRQTGD